MSRWRNVAAVAALAVAVAAAGPALWIEAKAVVAQLLLRAAWAETGATGDPARPWPWADTWPLARLEAPRLGIYQIILAGASGRTLAFGPAHIGASAAPGTGGNVVISGHRDTHFRFLQDLVPGDRLSIATPDGGSRAYTVTATEVVHVDNARLPMATPIPRLTLVTCWPFDALVPGGPMRYVVVAEASEPP